VDFEKGIVKNQSKNIALCAAELPPFILEMLSDGGLIENLRRRIKKK
jgi:3-isopropylmalate dehydratase small subunit